MRLWCIYRCFQQRRRAFYTNIFSVLHNQEMWNIESKHITAILRNKRERKYKTDKFLLNLVHVGFYWWKYKEQTICLGFQKVSNCHGWNVELENPPINVEMTFLVATLVWMLPLTISPKSTIIDVWQGRVLNTLLVMNKRLIAWKKL